MDNFFVYLLLFTELILLGIAWVNFKGDFVSPSVLTLLLFILSTTCFMLCLDEWTVEFGFKAYALFVSSFSLMIVIETLIKNRYKKRQPQNIEIVENKKVIYISQPYDIFLFCIFILASLVYVYRVYRSGMSLGATSLLTSIGINKEEGDYDSISRLLYNLTRMASYVHAVMFFNNVLTCKESIKKNLRSIIIVFVVLIMTFFSGQRSASICYLVGIIVAAAISLYMKGERKNQIDIKKFYKKMIVVAIIVVLLFYASSNIVKGTSIQRKFVSYILYYFGSTTALMGRIVYDPGLCHMPFVGYFGEKTFMGFWSTMYSWGVVNQAPADRRWINMGSKLYPTRAGNEYTFFCGPYIDFGFIGVLLFVIAFYGIFAYIYYKKIRNNKNIKNRTLVTSIYIFLYAMVAMSFYQDTIRTYSRPINILYIIYMLVFCKIFIRTRKVKQ